MKSEEWKEILEERKVTYTLEVDGRLIVVENVPARVNLEIGEQLFSPETVKRLPQMIRDQSKPKRVMQVLGDAFHGIVGSDHWSAYNGLKTTYLAGSTPSDGNSAGHT
jgi:YgiT-type zinc finger domain-containing protein